MRQRAFWMMLLAAACVAGCSKPKSSLYIDPGHRDGDTAVAQAGPPPQLGSDPAAKH
jgi:hypothetical protein